ncbi:hypothetical protein [Pedobacter alluvionis]|uniref:Uncharacterized protein n=1 Tax=Pedobacter alluvionis TaxID=475253 RepID=A0A497XVS3_9SPHI|nr:hypothetical protein [Pedobacter alluvionis]RLJ73853.1 hypothetical protein BCL90_4018 [Pedobacter alluvionis]
MPTTVKKGNQHTDHGNAVISKHVKGYENDLYFVKKADKATEILEKFGLPDVKKK